MVNDNLNIKEKESDSIKDILIKYFRYWWLLLSLIALLMAGAWIYIRYMATPEYTSTATLLIKDDRNNSNDVLKEILKTNSNKSLLNEIELLRSRTLIDRVVRSLNLNLSYYAKGSIKGTNVYKNSPVQLNVLSLNEPSKAFTLNLKLKGDSAFMVNNFPNSIPYDRPFSLKEGNFMLTHANRLANPMFDEYKVVWKPTESVTANIQGNIRIAAVDEFAASILRLTLSQENPEIARDALNQLMAEYERSNIEDKKRVGDSTLAFINKNLRKIEDELGIIETDFQDYKQKNNIINLKTQSDGFLDEATKLKEARFENDAKLSVANLVEAYVSGSGNSYQIIPSNLGIEDAVLLKLTNAYNEQVLLRERLLQTGTEQNPAVQEAEAGIKKTRESILENVRNIKRSMMTVQNSYDRKFAEVNGTLRDMPVRERQFRKKEREQQIKQNLYIYLLEKQQETGIAQASSLSNSRVIDLADINRNPTKPNKQFLYGMGLLLAIVLYTLIIYLIILLNDKVTTKNEITRATNAPILGEIGHYEGDKKDRPIVIAWDSRSVLAEQYRLIRTNLQFFMYNVKNPVILVTSTVSGEGKTFSSMNIGAILAFSGKKTVILEMDMRKPKIASSLGVSAKNGISTFLMGTSKVDDILVKVDEVENLYMIPCGIVPPNPSEILLSEHLPKLIAELRTKFDYVIIDSAPVGIVSDSLTLGNYADCTVFIVRQRYTHKKQLEYINSLYELKKLPHITLVVNDVKVDGLQSYYGYYSQGKYGYGSYETKK